MSLSRESSRAWALAASVVLCAGVAGAQTLQDRATVGFSFSHGTSLDSRVGTLEQRRQWDLRLPLPPVVLGRTYLVPSLGYETRRLGLERWGDAEDLSRSFHRIQLGLTLIRPLAPRWLLVVGATAGTRTDFRGPFDVGADMTWVGYAMASYMIGGDPGLRLSFGIVALWPDSPIPVLPMASFVYNKGPYIAELGLPRVNLLRRLGDGLEVGFVASYERQSFHGRMGVEAERAGVHYLRETSVRVAPTANIRVGKELWLHSAVGFVVLNGFDVLDRDRDRIDVAGLGASPAPYVRLALGWRPAPRAPATPRPPEPAPGSGPREQRSFQRGPLGVSGR